jgi:flagellar biosynthesis/type III secretory pathway protein FliH
VTLGNEASTTPRGRRAALVEVEAKERAELVLAAATRRAADILAHAERRAAETRATAEREGRADGLATAAELALRLRQRESLADEHARDRVVELSRLLAERLLGRALHAAPAEIAALAAQALTEAGGARRIALHAHPDDAAVLRSATSSFDPEGRVHTVVSDESLARGDLRLNTELGMIDARLGPELARLAERLREALEP